MKFLHLSDLHIGKRVNGISMLEDQAYILKKIESIVRSEQPDAVLIAGDIYDKTIPSGEAVQLLDDFLVRLAEQGTQILMIAGNHDSPERIAFGGRLMDARGVYIAPVYDGTVKQVTFTDEYGQVNVYLLPFLKPANVRSVYEGEPIESYTDAMQVVLSHLPLDPEARNILVAHQFVTGAKTCDSEEVSVGGLDCVSAAVFDGFDYVALGHLHGPQSVGRETVRYAGSPLKYSFSELNQQKSVTVVELHKKGETALRTIPLEPRRELRELRGTFAELTDGAFYGQQVPEDYYHITLTDEIDVPNAATILRNYYPNWMVLDYDNRRTRAQAEVEAIADAVERDPVAIFDELYTLQNGQPMNEAQRSVLETLVAEIWEEQE